MDGTDPRALMARHGAEMIDRYRRACQPHLSAAVWATICLRYEHGLTITQIAHIMKRSPSSISGRLTRARKLLERAEAAMRRERYELLRNRQEE